MTIQYNASKTMKQCHCGQVLKSCQYCQDRKNSTEMIKQRDYKREQRKMEKQLTKEQKLAAAFEIKCSGILYEPKGCTQKLGTYKDGCGKCGTGHLEQCLNNGK